MKMWDEVRDPESRVAQQRRRTEEWVREQLADGRLGRSGWTPGWIRARMLELNQEAVEDPDRGHPEYTCSEKFASELLLVLEGEGLLECRVYFVSIGGTNGGKVRGKRKVVKAAYPAGSGLGTL